MVGSVMKGILAGQGAYWQGAGYNGE